MATPASTLEEIIGESAPMGDLRKGLARILALSKQGRRLPPVLIQGETGTGKGLVAQLLHQQGPRAGGPFISLNCAAIPEGLLEAELFGYEAGAFTDAKRRKAGLVQSASGGVLFLDEIGLLPEVLQAKLLTTIESQRVRRLGATVDEPVDVWIVAATNLDLVAAVRERKFREDLYHRLAVLELRLPPLRERGGDAVVLARHFLGRFCGEYGLPPRRLLPAAEARLRTYSWPGNVRELANVIERATLMSTEPSIDAPTLGLSEPAAPAPAIPHRKEQGLRDELLAALNDTDWNITQTAARLGITRNTVRSRLERFGLHRGAPEPAPVPPLAAPPAATVPRAAPARLLRWERRRVVFLGASVRPADPETLTVAAILESILERILGFGGRLEGIRHHSVQAAFGLVPLDDIARRAVNAALAVQRSLGQQREPGLPPYSFALALHTAQLMVARVGGDVFMDEAGKAAAISALEALLAATPGGAILVTAELAPFLLRHFELAEEPSAPASLGRVHRVVRHDPTGVGAWRRLSPFVGRDYEFALLRQRWDQAREGRGQAVNLVGPAGVGKSRLAWEFSQYCAVAGRVLKASGTAIETAPPYLAIGQLLQDLMSQQDEHQDGRPLPERVAALVEGLGLSPAAVTAPILELLGQPSSEGFRPDPGPRRRQMITAVMAVLEAASARSPLALVVDDAQWLDSESLGLITALVDALAGQRILLLLNQRPTDNAILPGRAHCTEVRLGPLSERAARDLLDTLMGNDRSIEALKPRIAAWTEGNAFFLEESVRTLAEGGVLKGGAAAYRLETRLERLEVPSTVEGVLEERIQRLAPVDKTVLEAMAVAGVEVELSVLAPLVEIDRESLHASLTRLHAGEFIYQSHTSPDRTYTFTHALTREVAYQSLAPDRRQGLHAAALAVGEELYAADPDEKAEWLAFHALRGEVWGSAVNHLRRAAARGVARASGRAAVQHLESALGVLDRLPPSAERAELSIDLRIELRHALTPLGRVQRTLEHLRAAEALALERDDRARLGRILSFIANCLVLQGRYREAMTTGQRALDIAHELGDRPLRIATQMYVARARLGCGQIAAAVELLREIIQSLDERPTDEFLGLPVLPAAFARSNLASSLADLGAFAEAEAESREAIRRAEASGQPDSIMWAYRGLAMVALVRGAAGEAADVFDRLLTLCRAHDLDAYVSRILAGLGCARARLGRIEEGRDLLEQAVALDATAEPRTTYTLALGALAEAHCLAGDLGKSLAIAQEALQRARLNEERGAEAYVSWVRATAHASSAESLAAADTGFREAAAIAAELGLRPLLANCWLGLADVCERRGQSAEVAEHRGRGESLVAALGMRPWRALRIAI